MNSLNPFVRLGAACVALTLVTFVRASDALPARWTTSWFTSEQLTEPHNMPPEPGLSHATLRQFIYPTLGGTQLRLTLSNAFGNSAVIIKAVHIAVAGEGDAIDVRTDHPVLFHGAPGVTIQTSASIVSDPVAMPIGALRRLAVTIAVEQAPAALTGHPGSRTTSYFCPGDAVAEEHLTSPAKTDHWYLLTALDVATDAPASAVVALGDSITDGRGSTTNANDRWPDDLARRLQANRPTANVAVLNAGIGGNRLLRDGLGPNALARLDRDALAPAGVKWVIVFEGINDIGTSRDAPPANRASAEDIIAAYEQIVTRAHAHGLRVIGATITPYAGADFYYSAEGEAERQAVNAWIRQPGHFDAFADLDATLRDPKSPGHLAAEYDSGDHLHPSPKGYEAIAAAIDLTWFER